MMSKDNINSDIVEGLLIFDLLEQDYNDYTYGMIGLYVDCWSNIIKHNHSSD